MRKIIILGILICFIAVVSASVFGQLFDCPDDPGKVGDCTLGNNGGVCPEECEEYY